MRHEFLPSRAYYRRGALRRMTATVTPLLLLLQPCPCVGSFVVPTFNPNSVSRISVPSSYRHSKNLSNPRFSVNSPDPIASVDALDRLVPRTKIKALSQTKSNAQGLVQVAFHFSLLWLAQLVAPISNAASLLATAFVSAFYFNGLHETVHRTAFASNVLNDVFAQIFGLLCLRPARHYYYYHWQHHRYTGNPELDSELQPGFLDFPVSNAWSYLLYLSGIPFWIDAVITTVKHALGHCPEAYLVHDKACKTVTNEARIYLALYGLIWTLAATGGKSISAPLLRLWVLPALLGQPFLRFYLLAEHRGRKRSPIIYENTRSMMGTNSFYRKLAWQMPYHIEHHAWPSLPFHKLTKAHELLISAPSKEDDRGNDDCAPGTSGKDLLHSGEMYPELSQSGEGGYVGFNRRFLRTLVQRE
mmetsp:Transcript_15903/g.32013  ORF Transcript_15903/g.32013 Transcript_15903/m.32013 type:complete len:416 (-) Transcript_15903:48-1295(-)